MGQKVNPHGARVGVIKDWNTRWYADKKNFADNLVSDAKLRKMIKELEFVDDKSKKPVKLYDAGISSIEIERRFDNVIYRMGFAASHKEARQLVLHGHFTVNGKKVNIPSLIVKAGDVVAVKESSRASEKFKGLAESAATHHAPKWLEVKADAFTAKVTALPAREDVDFDFNEQLIVELYSK